MQADVVVFVPKAKLSARANLAAFIGLCRGKLTVFGSDLDFDADVWDVSEWVKFTANKGAYRIRFSNLATASKRCAMVPMADPFKSFVKAFIRYQHAHRPRENYSNCLSALRALEVALQELTGDCEPADIRPDVLNRAAAILKESMAPSTAYNCGCELEALSDLVCHLRLVTVPTSWKHSLPPVGGSRTRVGKEFDDLRREKMPSPAAFYALGEIFQNETDAEDILVSSSCAILCSAPSRVAEVVLLPSVCEVTQTDLKTGAVAYGLGWRPAKNGKPMVKYMATPMHDIVRAALERLRALSAPAMELVRWYEANPDKLFLPPALEHLRGRSEIDMTEVRSIVFEDDGKTYASRAWQWVRSQNLPLTKRGASVFASFPDIESAVLRMLPRGFPTLDEERGLRFSDALMVVRKQELDPDTVTYRCMFQPVEPNDINSRISTRPTLSLFRKHGFTEDDGSQIVITTHKFRHYLNTLAQTNNMDQLDLARWSGRRDVSQNAAYDHVSDREVTEKLRLALQGEAAAVGPIARLHKVALVPRDQFARLRIRTAHTTDYGYCIHDFTMLPCPKHQDCANCEEQACIKGEDAHKEENIRASREETRGLLESAKLALDDGEYGADRWVRHQQLTFDRLDSLCSILDDDAVPSGAVIRLDDSPVQSSIERALQRRPLSLGKDLLATAVTAHAGDA